MGFLKNVNIYFNKADQRLRHALAAKYAVNGQKANPGNNYGKKDNNRRKPIGGLPARSLGKSRPVRSSNSVVVRISA